jgi:FkbM family methyltransferase
MTFNREEYILQSIPIEKELEILLNSNSFVTIFEIGACEGEDSIRYSRLFKNSKIYAFEPLPQNVGIIERNISKYNVKNVRVFNKALSSNNGTAEFYVSTGRPEGVPESDWDYGNKSSSLLQPDKHGEMAPFIEFKTKVIVDTITLKSFCNSNNINQIDYVHMDVQGAELMVLQGAGDFINFIKVIWLEVSKIHLYKDQPLVDEINKFMIDNNFVLAKDCIEDVQGDQLYISKVFYSDYENIIKKLNQKHNSLLTKILKKIGLR